MDSMSYSTYTSTQDASPARINFTRPLCFCGFTSVSIYPEPPRTITRRSISAPLPPTPPSPRVKSTNWVYECHFSPKQRGMASPEPCKDCEQDRKRRVNRDSVTQEVTWFTGPSSGEGCERHRAVKYDEVELWPRKKPATTTTNATKHDYLDNAGTKTSTQFNMNIVGADIQAEAIYLNEAPMDGRRKVCGFHMHALEWHHMQTLDVNQILMVAKNTSCGYFNLSVVRWLGVLAKTTTIKNSNIDTNYHLGLKLFHKVRCFCDKEAGLARGPAVASSTPAPRSTTINNNNNNSNNSGDNKEYFVMCAGRVYDNHTAYKMVPQPGSDAYYSYNIRSWIKKSGRFITCSLQIKLQKVVFEVNLLPIHARICVTDWLSQWLKPIPLTPPNQPRSVSSSGLGWLQRTNELLTTIREPTTASSSSSAGGPKLQAPLTGTRIKPLLGVKKLAAVRDVGPNGLMMSSTRAQVKERDQLNSTSGLNELDKELKEVLTRHAAAVVSIRERVSMLSSRSEEQDRYRKEIDMTAFTSVTMLLCHKCKDNNARDFCVIPYAGSSSTLSPPMPPASRQNQPQGQGTTATSTQTAPTTSRSAHLPSPEGTDDECVDAPGSKMDDLFDLLDPLTGLIALDAESEEADRELEWTLTRHAKVFERTMEVRSRLVPDFLQCRGCSFREAGVDILPCHHHFLCADCVERIEFYLVPHGPRG